MFYTQIERRTFHTAWYRDGGTFPLMQAVSHGSIVKALRFSDYNTIRSKRRQRCVARAVKLPIYLLVIGSP
jgi:hypothetical protein